MQYSLTPNLTDFSKQNITVKKQTPPPNTDLSSYKLINHNSNRNISTDKINITKINTEYLLEVIRNKDKNQVPRIILGVDGLKKYVQDYEKETPLKKEDYAPFLDVLKNVSNFEDAYKEIYGKTPEDNTYCYEKPFKPRELSDAICFTFHQNSSANAPFEKYDDVTYAKLIAICYRKFEEQGISKDKLLLNIGYYGNAEVSFSLDMNLYKSDDIVNLNKVQNFAIKFNQQSVYLTFFDATILNQYYNKDANPILAC